MNILPYLEDILFKFDFFIDPRYERKLTSVLNDHGIAHRAMPIYFAHQQGVVSHFHPRINQTVSSHASNCLTS